MATMNYWGFQGALPSYSIPWGIWVNKSLATENNIDVPDIDWDIDNDKVCISLFLSRL